MNALPDEHLWRSWDVLSVIGLSHGYDFVGLRVDHGRLSHSLNLWMVFCMAE